MATTSKELRGYGILWTIKKWRYYNLKSSL